MNKPEKLVGREEGDEQPVFVSYASADRKEALAVCKAIERHGLQCWISTRDVEPGENYQESIVRALRSSRAMVLVFSDAANNSDEIKKELSLASRYHISVMALRIEDVEPSDAFAYELSTRQWIDAFESWDKSIDALVRKIEQVSGREASAPVAVKPSRRATAPSLPRRPLAIAASLLVLLLASAVGWYLLRSRPAVAHTMQVRLTGFKQLSADLPATLPAAMDDEINAAFNDDGVIGISTAAAPPPGSAPAYALGGTVRHDGDKIRIIARLTDERSGTTLWSNTYSYDASSLPHVPRWTAVETSQVVRCGLFGASTYSKALPDAILSDYLELCGTSSPTKSLDLARKVVAAAPDFSWGWSAVENAALASAFANPPGAQRAALRKQAMEAADKAIALDPANSEAYSVKSYIVDSNDLIGREALLKQAIAARPLACGCEHHLYADFLMEVGRTQDAISEYRRSIDVLPLNGGSQIGLAKAMIISGNPEAAKQPLETAIDLVDQPALPDLITLQSAVLTGKYTGADTAIQNPKLGVPTVNVRALVDAFKAMQSGNGQAKAAAAAEINALPPEMISLPEVPLLGALGDNAGALRQIQAAASREAVGARSWLFYPTLAAARADPSFPAVVQKLGLVRYWKTTHTRPDVCTDKNPPPFCRMI